MANPPISILILTYPQLRPHLSSRALSSTSSSLKLYYLQYTRKVHKLGARNTRRLTAKIQRSLGFRQANTLGVVDTGDAWAGVLCTLARPPFWRRARRFVAEVITTAFINVLGVKNMVPPVIMKYN